MEKTVLMTKNYIDYSHLSDDNIQNCEHQHCICLKQELKKLRSIVKYKTKKNKIQSIKIQQENHLEVQNQNNFPQISQQLNKLKESYQRLKKEIKQIERQNDKLFQENLQLRNSHKINQKFRQIQSEHQRDENLNTNDSMYSSGDLQNMRNNSNNPPIQQKISLRPQFCDKASFIDQKQEFLSFDIKRKQQRNQILAEITAHINDLSLFIVERQQIQKLRKHEIHRFKMILEDFSMQ